MPCEAAASTWRRVGTLRRGEERRSPRPHIRPAHWHAYWTGPRSDPDKRRIILHWLPPIPINMGDLDEIVPTIRQVKGKRKKEEPQS